MSCESGLARNVWRRLGTSRVIMWLRATSTLLALFHFFQSARPVFAEQTAECAVGQQVASGLAAHAVIRLIGRVANALDFRAATRTGFAIASVDGHAFVKRSDFFRKFTACFGAEILGPFGECFARGQQQTVDFFGTQSLGQRHGRELSAVKNLIRVSVPDSAE